MLKKALAATTLLLFVCAAALAAAPAKEPITFSKHVAPIVFKNCAGCHRPGEVAPFSLLTWKDARPWAKSIREKVLERAMPPWYADPSHGKFSNDRRLSQKEIDTLVAWVDGGARQGDPQDLPAAPEYPDGWNIGKPDVVFSMPEEYQVPAEGVIEYEHFMVPTNFTEDRWLQAAEIRPGNRSLVHHVIVFAKEPDNQPRRALGIKFRTDLAPPPEKATADDIRKGIPPRGRLGTLLVGIAPGERPVIFNPGTARLIKAGTNLIFQVHYTPNGTPGKDRTSVGLIFAKQPPEHQMRTAGVMNGRFVIPPGDPNYKVESSAEFTEDAQIWGLFPHMHLRGKSFEYRLVYPDGKSEVILSVPKYDFNWQTGYQFAEPLHVPKGSRLECTAYFDNSPGNRANPDPTKEVRWGDQTWDEMMIGYTTYSLGTAPKAATTAK